MSIRNHTCPLRIETLHVAVPNIVMHTGVVYPPFKSDSSLHPRTGALAQSIDREGTVPATNATRLSKENREYRRR